MSNTGTTSQDGELTTGQTRDRTQTKTALVLLADMPDVLTVAQLAQVLCIGRNAAYELVRLEVVRSLRWGNKIRVPKCQVERMLQES